MRFALAALIACSFPLSAAETLRPAPELIWKTPAGETLQLSKYKGKVVVLEILSTTCSHCQQGARVLSRIQKEFSAKDLQPLGYSLNPDADVPEFVRTLQVTFPVGKGTHDGALSFLQHSVLKNLYYPVMVFIDRNGMIQAQYTGTDAFLKTNEENNIRELVRKMIASGTTSAPKSRKKAS